MEGGQRRAERVVGLRQAKSLPSPTPGRTRGLRFPYQRRSAAHYSSSSQALRDSSSNGDHNRHACPVPACSCLVLPQISATSTPPLHFVKQTARLRTVGAPIPCSLGRYGYGGGRGRRRSVLPLCPVIQYCICTCTCTEWVVVVVVVSCPR